MTPCVYFRIKQDFHNMAISKADFLQILNLRYFQKLIFKHFAVPDLLRKSHSTSTREFQSIRTLRRNQRLDFNSQIPRLSFRKLSTASPCKMADDTSYNTFLTRANQDPSSGHDAEGHSTSQARSQFDPSSKSSSSAAVPASLRNIDVTFTSDTDAEFEPVFFSYASDDLPSLEEFTKVLGVKGENAANVEELDLTDFDPRGQYKEVIEKVKTAGMEARGKRGAGAGKGGAKVFKVQLDGSGTRVEYYIVSVGERSLLGLVAKAVES